MRPHKPRCDIGYQREDFGSLAQTSSALILLTYTSQAHCIDVAGSTGRSVRGPAFHGGGFHQRL